MKDWLVAFIAAASLVGLDCLDGAGRHSCIGII
jgi:hypothetical protein